MKELIGWTKSLFWADKVASWAQREVAIRAQIKAVMKIEIKLSSFFLFLLACFVHAFFVVAQGMSNVLVENAYSGTISPLYRSPHWEALALSLKRDLFAYLSTFLIATSFFCVGGNRAFNNNNTQALKNNTTVAGPSLSLLVLSL